MLSDKAILEAMKREDIKISPFNLSCLGSNSYDVHLSKHLATYDEYGYIDAKKDNKLRHFEIGEEGFVLMPNQLYLGSTVEYTETHNFVPFIEGKSSSGRLGISIHATAGKGDAGFCGHWTLEITVTVPVKVYANMPIAQLIFWPVTGEIKTPYSQKASAKYNQQGKLPVGSQMFKNF